MSSAAAMVVAGTFFNVFALVSYSFKMDADLAWIYACFGTGLWLLAAGVSYFFLSDPQPRHGRRR